jgi:hypothetical protein
MKIINQIPETPKYVFTILNNVYEIQRKAQLSEDTHSILRNTGRITETFSDLGYFFEDPMGQEFKDTRTDLEATISGTQTENLYVVEVIKPIIRVGNQSLSKVIQKGIVVVESKK